MRKKVALATSAKWPDLAPEDSDLVGELGAFSLEALPAVWSNRSLDWSQFAMVIIRSCWDYHTRVEEFRAWCERLDDAGVTLYNPPAIVRWNLNKRYLLELAAKGVSIPRTEFVRTASSATLAGKVIVKPVISAAAFETHLFDDSALAAAAIDRLGAAGEVIVQEFIAEVIDGGEWSLMFLDREFSHAVRKLPKTGDFRVQEELGGSSVAATPSAQLLREAERIVTMIEGDLLYARVDLVERPGGGTLMEIELIEPSLFFKSAPGSARRFASAVNRRAQTTSGA